MNLIIDTDEEISDFFYSFSPDGRFFGVYDNSRDRLLIWEFNPVDSSSISNFEYY